VSVLFDLPYAQYLDAGPTALPGLTFRNGQAVLGCGRGYLGVLTPAALARLGAPSQDEVVSDALSAYLSVMLQGVRSGAGAVQGDGATALLRFATPRGERHRVHSDPTLRNALFSRSPSQGLLFEATLVTDHDVLLRVDPFMRVEQAGHNGFGCFFDCAAPVRVFLAGAALRRVFDFAVSA